MLSNFLALALAALAGQAQAKSVFAHFIVGNANGNNDQADWTADITAAKAAGIDGFALNIAANQDNDQDTSISYAFIAANAIGDFKLFFSFDFDASTPTWTADAISAVLSPYIPVGNPNGAYFLYNGKPMVSTFEGPDQSDLWTSLKSEYNLFFIPDWSSKDPTTAIGLSNGVADGLFSWNAWPRGPTDMTTTNTDEPFVSALNGKPYMMPVSPWFFTNLPNYSKNWLWRGDDLWYDRWQQVLTIDPEFVEIITWNDYGESHYIGPINSKDLGLFGSNAGNAPFDYAQNNPHDGWRTFLPYIISQYKTGSAPSISSEEVVAWYRLNPNTASGCSTGGTLGNNLDQGDSQTYAPSLLDLDYVFFTALLDSTATVSVTIGSTVQTGSWTSTPSGGSGLYHGKVAFSGNVGPVTVTINRNGGSVVSVTGSYITTDCTDGVENWNAAVFTSDSSL